MPPKPLNQGAEPGLETSFEVRIVEDVKLSIETIEGSEALNAIMHAPEAMVQAIASLGTSLDGTLSPLSKVTVKGDAAFELGIPEGAAHYAFFYPLNLDAVQTEHIMVSAVQGQAADTSKKGGGVPAWLELLLFGGYAYFDEKRRLIRCNALSTGLDMSGDGASAHPQRRIASASAPAAPRSIGTRDALFSFATRAESCTVGNLVLNGPLAAPAAVAHALESAGRLRPLTSTRPELRAAGFASFGWLLAKEELGGAALRNETGMPDFDRTRATAVLS